MKNILNTTETISELEVLIKELGHFPKQKELQGLYKNNIIRGINKIGGLNKVQELMGFKVGKLQKYWTEEKCIAELQKIMNDIGHFPLYEELRPIGKGGLAKAISKNGGINKYRSIFNMPFILSPVGYWTEEKCILDLNKIIENIGHFPLQKELIKLNKQDLVGGINKNGGLTTIKKHMGYKIDKVLKGYWTENRCIEELKKIIDTTDYFPSQLDLSLINKTDLSNAIRKHGGLVKFRDMMGYHIDKSSSSRYNIIRGKNTENILFDILSDYCKKKEIPLPIKNVKLAHKNIIEFVCSSRTKIGLDITTTHSAAVVYRKWREKEYYKYLDELWIIVVSDTFKQQHYIEWNKESPDNVYVYSIEDFCKELEYDIQESLKNKIEKYKSCTFHTRNTKQ